MKKISILILLTGFVLIASSGFTLADTASERNIIVTDGTAEVTGRNDSAEITIAVITQAKRLGLAGSENDAKTGAVLESVKGLDIANLKLHTAGYRVTPQRDYKARPPEIKGYEVYNAVEAVLEGFGPKELSRHVTEIIGNALESGANSIQAVQFYIQNKDSLETEALKKAVAQAVLRAKAMAAAAGVKLKRIVSLSTQPLEMPPQPRMQRALEMKADAVEAAPPMEIGETRVRAQVSIVYEIEP